VFFVLLLTNLSRSGVDLLKHGAGIQRLGIISRESPNIGGNTGLLVKVTAETGGVKYVQTCQRVFFGVGGSGEEDNKIVAIAMGGPASEHVWCVD
jgi:hypothetical protein